MAKRCVIYRIEADPRIAEIADAIESGAATAAETKTARDFLMEPELFLKVSSREYDAAVGAPAAGDLGARA